MTFLYFSFFFLIFALEYIDYRLIMLGTNFYIELAKIAEKKRIERELIENGHFEIVFKDLDEETLTKVAKSNKNLENYLKERFGFSFEQRKK
jgi:hypothetical protein